jgi:hypothetical protein
MLTLTELLVFPFILGMLIGLIVPRTERGAR